MKKKLIIPLLFALLLTACGQQEPEEEIIFGDIDMTTDYTKSDFQAPSAVTRKEELPLDNIFFKMQLSETEEMKTGTLPTIAGDEYQINRVQYNGVYFDINQIANKTDYSISVDNGIVNLTIPRENGVIKSSVAQIADASLVKEGESLGEEDFEEILGIIEEYNEIYANTENQSSNKYGYYYTYDKYVDWLNNHSSAKYNITMYSPAQVLKMAIDIFGINKSEDDFYINTNADLLEVSDWYRVIMSFRYEKEGEDTIEIAVKSSPDGIFLFMTEYTPGMNVDENGNIYFTPTMIINIAQNNYCQLAEDAESKAYRDNYFYSE